MLSHAMHVYMYNVTHLCQIAVAFHIIHRKKHEYLNEVTSVERNQIIINKYEVHHSI